MSDYADTSRLTHLLDAWSRRLPAVVERVLAAIAAPRLVFASASRRTATRSFTPARGAARAADRSGEPKIVPPTPTEDPDSIVGGKPTSDFPDCCAVGNDTQYYCTGTLIAPNLVVTAEHCTGATRVFLVGDDIANPGNGEEVRVARDIRHPTADLRVLVLDADSSATPRHIAQGAEISAATTTLAGFGTIDFDGTVGYGIKRRVEVPITSIDCAAPGDDVTFGCVPGIEMVAGQRGLAMDSCHGDSGGPLYIQNDDGEIYLLGATSRGVTNADVACGDGGIYVRVDQFVDWITAETGISLEGPRI